MTFYVMSIVLAVLYRFVITNRYVPVIRRRPIRLPKPHISEKPLQRYPQCFEFRSRAANLSPHVRAGARLLTTNNVVLHRNISGHGYFRNICLIHLHPGYSRFAVYDLIFRAGSVPL